MAEDIAICDILSGGRFDLGIGPGSQFEEFRTFGIDPKTMNGRMYESIDWILRAFDEKDEFSHKGKYYDIPNMTFTTKPVQNPIPVWSSSMGPRNAARSAERGFHFIGPGNFGYDGALAAAGRNPGDYKIASMQLFHISDSTDQAWEEAAPGLEYFVNFYNMRLNLDGQPQGNEYITQEMLRAGMPASGRQPSARPTTRSRPSLRGCRASSVASPSSCARSGTQACGTRSCTNRCDCSTSTSSPRWPRSLPRTASSESDLDRPNLRHDVSPHHVRIRREGLGALGRCHVLGFGAVEVAVVRDCPDELAVVVVCIGENDVEPVLGTGFDDGAEPRDEIVHPPRLDGVPA